MWWMFAVAAASTGTGQMEGVVTSGLDGRGLSGVDIVLRLDVRDAADARHVRTDRSGTFRFEDLPPGRYALDVIGSVPVANDLVGVWTHVSPVLVVPGLTATRQVVLTPPAAPPKPRES